MSTVDRGRVMRRVAVLARYWEGILDAELRPVGVTTKQLQLLGVIERDFGGAGDGESAPGGNGVAHSEPAECPAPAGASADQSGAPTASEVAEAMVTSHQNVMQIARALERRGFLRIERDATDRRVRRLVLTDEHRQFWRERGQRDEGGLDHLFSVLSPEELACLDGALERLVPFTERIYRRRGGASP